MAGECEVCTLADDASIDNHLITCPSCVEHRFKAEQVVEQTDRMRALTEEEEIERRHKIVGRRTITIYSNLARINLKRRERILRIDQSANGERFDKWPGE